MFILIINSILLVVSLFLIVFDSLFIKNTNKTIEQRIQRYIFGGIELLGIGIIIVTLAMIGRDEYTDIGIQKILVFVLLSFLCYIGLIILWHRLYLSFFENIPKKVLHDYKYKFKSIAVYGLVYCFGILFYIIYMYTFLIK